MPITPDALKRVRRAFTFDYLGESVNLVYYPSAVGGNLAARMSALLDQAQAATTEAEAEAVMRTVGEFLCSLIAGWDFLCEDGVTPQPLTPENMAAVMEQWTHFMMCILRAIITDHNQGNASGAPTSASSVATSSATEKSLTVPTQTAPSTSMQASLNPFTSSLSPAGSEELPALNGSSNIRTGSRGRKSAP